MKTLELVLQNKWFDMIECGKKKEEYREIKPYWAKRLVKFCNDCYEPGSCRNYIQRCILLKPERIEFVDFDRVRFRRGYTTRTISVKIENIKINYGLTEWGAMAGEKYFVIRLGKIISSSM